MLSARLIWGIHTPTCSRLTLTTLPMEACLTRLTRIEAPRLSPTLKGEGSHVPEGEARESGESTMRIRHPCGGSIGKAIGRASGCVAHSASTHDETSCCAFKSRSMT